MKVDLKSIYADEAERQGLISDSEAITIDWWMGWLSDANDASITHIKDEDHPDGLYLDEQTLARAARELMPADLQLIMDEAETDLKAEIPEDYHSHIAAKVFVRADIQSMTLYIRHLRPEVKT